MTNVAAIHQTARWARATGRRVRGRLAESEISQEQAAKALGLSQPALSRRLSGQVDFSISELIELAAHLRVPLQELLPRVDSNHQPAGLVTMQLGGLRCARCDYRPSSPLTPPPFGPFGHHPIVVAA